MGVLPHYMARRRLLAGGGGGGYVSAESSLLLNGTDATVTAPDSGDWQFGTDGATIEFFVRFNSVDNSQILMCQAGSSAGQFAWQIYYYPPTNRLIGVWSKNGTTLPSRQATFVPTVGVWYHVAMVFTGALIHFWIDGIYPAHSGSGTEGAMFNANAPLMIGGRHDGSFTDGWIDEVRITKGVQRYSAGNNYTPPSEPYGRNVSDDPNFASVVFLSGFDGVDGATSAVDDSNSGHTLTFNGNAQIDTAQFKF